MPILGYAGDIKISSDITCSTDAEKLLVNVNVLHQWCNKNKLKLNIENIFTFTTSPSHIVLHQRHTSSSKFKALGVILDGFIVRIAKYFTNNIVLKTLCYAYVLSKLKYACLIWYLLYASDFLLLDGIYRKFLNFLTYKLNGAYSEMGHLADRTPIKIQYVVFEHQARQYMEEIFNEASQKLYWLSIQRMSFLVQRLGVRYDDTFMILFARTNVMSKNRKYGLVAVAQLHRLYRNKNARYLERLYM